MNKRLDDAVGRLLRDRRFGREFRRDPAGALRRYELTSEEIAAVKDGDARDLLRLGLDPGLVWPKPRRSLLWLLPRARRLTPALLLVALAAPASAFGAPPPSAPGRARRSRVGRISSYFGRRGVGGEFHSRFARTGRAGRATSRAARGADSSAYVSRARRSARDFGIEPPPPPNGQ